MTTPRRYDTVVVGGGVAGLMITYRLSSRGASVLLLEADRIGCGATGRNQGIVHSGCLMARLHLGVGQACREAQPLFAAAFPDALRATRASWYFAQQPRFEEFEEAWRAHGFAYQPVDPCDAMRWLRPDVVESSGFAKVHEPIVDTTAMLSDLTARCRRAGADVVTGVRVDRLERSGTRVTGVRMATGERVRADWTVLAAGLGIRRLLESASSTLPPLLRSRKVLLASYRHRGLPVSLLCLDFGGPTAIPVSRDRLVLGRYGGSQPATSRPDGAIDMYLVRELDESGRRHLGPDSLGPEPVAVWMSTKTEIADQRADAWGTQPGFFVADHAAIEGLHRLITAIPGKMSLAMHTSQVVLHAAGMGDEELGLPASPACPPHQHDVGDQVAGHPWLEPERDAREFAR